MSTIAKFHRLSHRWRPTAYRPRAADAQCLDSIKQLASSIQSLADNDLASRYNRLQETVCRGEPLLSKDVLVPCFALVHEAIRRTLAIEYYDVQLMAGLALSTGAIAEMKTGEGKTVVAALPAALHSLNEKGVHVATVNSYLAERDCHNIRRTLQLLGLSVGISRQGDELRAKQAAYRCDITYSTGYELGFDFLRDQATGRAARRPQLGESFRERLRGDERRDSEWIQRGHHFAIIDEVDSVLIDEANTPLVLSGRTEASLTSQVFTQAAIVASQLKLDRDFVIDRRKRSLQLTVAGQRHIYRDPSAVPATGLCRPWSVYIEQALRAEHIFRRDVDYVVRDESIMLVDHYTGRIFADRCWRDGLHQAVECREHVPITPERQSLARISRQRYFGMYQGLCGMSGTCTGHESELLEFYRLPIVVIPERLPNRRTHLPTRYFAGLEDKWNAITTDIRGRQTAGQPTLVGTRTIEESVAISQRLNDINVPHRLLNGCQDENEAQIVANAGQLAAVTIATNMAGRGTDIIIDDAVEHLGGLHVIATERQESARIDRQLVGRSARQGQAGSCQFFVSSEDNLLSQFGERLTGRLNDCPVEGESAATLDKSMGHVQARAERQSYQLRCELFQQDRWLNDVLVTVAEESMDSLLNSCHF